MKYIVPYENCDFNIVYEQTVADMRGIGTYKDEFIPVITRYCEMRVQFTILMTEWYENGCKITEKYKNKSGATNNRKAALYQSIENLRREILELENILGLTPAGLKRIVEKSMTRQKESRLTQALKQNE